MGLLLLRRDAGGGDAKWRTLKNFCFFPDTGEGDTMKLKPSILFLSLLIICVLAVLPWRIQQAKADVGPVTIGTTNATTPTAYTFQRKAFYAVGRHWAFYASGTAMVYYSSVDGITWNGPATVRTCNYGRQFSVVFDGTYVHYAFAPEAPDSALLYRRGTPYSNGTITWGSEQTAVAGSSVASWYTPFVAIDGAGCPWIGYRWYDYPEVYEYPYLTKSSANNGTWVTQSGFPLQLNTTSHCVWLTSILKLTQNKTYVLYFNNDGDGYGRLWNGTGFETLENVALTDVKWGNAYSAVAFGNDIHVVWLSQTAQNIIYRKRTYGSGWGSEETLATALSSVSTPALSCDVSYQKLWCFWQNNNHTYYKSNCLGVWDSDATDWIDESVDGIYRNDQLNCYETSDEWIGVMYITPYSATPTPPFNVRIKLFKYAAQAPTISSFQAPTGRISINSYFYLNATVNDAEGIADLQNATLTLNYTINLNWFNSNTFTKTGDANGYCTLGSNSKRTTVNATAYKLSWNISLSVNLNWDIVSAKVYDSGGLHGTNSATDLFLTEYVKIDTFTVSDNHVNIGDTASFTVAGKYASDNSAWSGTYTLNDTTSKSTVGKYWYKVSSITDSNYGITAFSQTASNVYVIFDRAVITISANTTNPAPNKIVSFTITAVYDYDDSPITSFTVNTYRNSTHFATGNFTDTNPNATLCYYTLENFTESTYGITAFTFTPNPLSVYWSDYVALTVKAVDSSNTIMVGAIVNFDYGIGYNRTTDSSGIATLTEINPNDNVTTRVMFQGVWVSETTTTNMTTTKMITTQCWIYSLTVWVTDTNNQEKSGAVLTLTRSDGANLTSYGLTPKTANYYNSTHACFVWQQLANQTASYTVFASLGGQTASKITALTSNTEIKLTLPAGTTSSPSGGTQPQQQPSVSPTLPISTGPEFDYGTLVLAAVIIVALGAGVAGVAKTDKRTASQKLREKWKKKTRSRYRRG